MCWDTDGPLPSRSVRRRRLDSRRPTLSLTVTCPAGSTQEAGARGGPLALGSSAADRRFEPHLVAEPREGESSTTGPAGRHRGRAFVRALPSGPVLGRLLRFGEASAQGRPDSDPRSPELRGEPAAHFQREGHWLQGVRARGAGSPGSRGDHCRAWSRWPECPPSTCCAQRGLQQADQRHVFGLC